MRCLIAVEETIALKIKNNLQEMKDYGFSGWSFDVCSDSSGLKEWSDIDIDVLVLSRFLPGTDPLRLLQQVNMLFSTAHIVLLVGQVSESCKSYMRAAAKSGLHNIVTGELPGDRPYTLMVALTRSKIPEMDGYDELAPEPEEAYKPTDDEYHPAELAALPEEYDEYPLANPVRQITGKGLLVAAVANKGGVGKTTVALATALALSRGEVPTALVDLDFGGTSITTFFNITGVPGIERLSGMSLLNPGQIDRLLVKQEDNLCVLPGPMDATVPHFESDELVAVLDYLRDRFSVVLVDTSPEVWMKPWMRSVFKATDVALAVVDQSKFSLEETRAYAPHLWRMGITPEKIRIVVNRYSPTLQKINALEATINSGFKGNKHRIRISAVIPADWEGAVRDTFKGEISALGDPSSHWHKLAREIASLAGARYSYAPRQKGAAQQKSKSILGQLISGRSGSGAGNR